MSHNVKEIQSVPPCSVLFHKAKWQSQTLETTLLSILVMAKNIWPFKNNHKQIYGTKCSTKHLPRLKGNQSQVPLFVRNVTASNAIAQMTHKSSPIKSTTVPLILLFYLSTFQVIFPVSYNISLVPPASIATSPLFFHAL